MIITRDEAVSKYKELFQSVPNNPVVDVAGVIEKFVSFYRESRISGSSIEHQGDMLLFEWGVTRPHILDKVTDFTDEYFTDKRVEFHPDNYKYLGITRQIHESDSEDTEFDGDAIGLCIYFHFNLSKDNDPSGNRWIDGPDEIEDGLTECFRDAYVSSLLKEQPSRTNVFISGIG